MKHYKYFLCMLLLLWSGILQAQEGFNPGNPPEPNALYELSLKISTANTGSVSGSGKYALGTSVRVYAYNNAGFKFKSWNEGNDIVSTSSTFNYTMSAKNTTLTAIFEYEPTNPAEPNTPVIPKKYTLNITSQPAEGGTFSPSTGNRYEEGAYINLYAYPNSGFKFKEWKDGETVISTNQYYYNYQMGTEDKILTAVFYYDPNSPSEPNVPTNAEHGLISLNHTGEKGQTIAFPIYLLNRNLSVNSVQFDIKFPEGASIDYQNIILSGRKNGHEVTTTHDNSNIYHISIKSESNQFIFDSDGILATIPITLPSTWNVGESYQVLIDNIILGTEVGDIQSSSKNGYLSIKESIDYSIYASFNPTKFLNRVVFTNISSETATNFRWDFGDSNTSTEKTPLHVYQTPGYYDVKLVASNTNASDSITLNIGIDSENTWNVSGAFSLNKHKKDVKNFTSLEELFLLISRSSVTNDLSINTESGETFEIPYQTLSDYLPVLISKLEQNNYIINFNKDGSGNNPIISITGIPTELSALNSLFSNLIFTNVDLLLFGTKIDISQTDNIRDQSVCSGNTSTAVNLSLISNDLNYSWELKNSPQSISGYQSSGIGDIPAMRLSNTSAEKEILTYIISIKLSSITLFELEYSLEVIPTLSGTVENLFPNINNEVSNTSVELSWSPVDNALYDIYLWENGTAVPTLPLASNIGTFRHTITCQYGKNYTWKVIAKNECTTIESDTAQFQVRRLPDLHVTKIENSSLYAGQTASASWTVKNNGLGATVESSWTDRIWLISVAEDGTDAEYATLLKSIANVSGLGIGESYENTVDVTIPERIVGTYYLLATTDMSSVYSIDWAPTGGESAPNPYIPDVSGSPYPYLFASRSYGSKAVKEASDDGYKSDNFFYKQVNILSSPVPDLVVTNSSFQTSIFSGNKMDVSWTVKNQGEKAISESSWQDAIYISLADVLDNSAIYVGNYKHQGELGIGESYNATLNVAIPNYLTGDYKVFIKTDATDQIYESIYENNNDYKSSLILQVILTPTPDLTVSDLIAPESIGVKEICTIEYTVKNQGAGATIEGAWKDVIYLSPTSTFSSQTAKEVHTSWHHSNLEIDESYKTTATVTVPDGISGDWYFIVKVDAGGHVFEYLGEDNNELVCNHATSILFPDLKISSLVIPETIQANEKVEISWTVENIGTGNITDISVTDKIYISPSPIWHEVTAKELISYEYKNNLKTGESITHKKDIELPCQITGTYYFHIKTDFDDKVYENNLESNNQLVSEGRLLRTNDLVIENASVSETTIGSGKQIDLSWIIKQTGEGILTNHPVIHNFYLSQNATANPSMEKIGTYSATVTLEGKNTTVVCNNSITMPNGISGEYYIIVRTNADSLVCENSYANNDFATQVLTVTLSPSPDLQTTVVEVPADIMASNLIDVQYEITNKGIADITSEIWTDKLYISMSDIFDETAILLTEIQQNRSLVINDSYTEKVSATIPASLSGGTYYVLVHTDANDDLYEHLTEDNNFKASAAVSITPYPLDIVAESIVAENQVKWQQQIPVQFTVHNISEKSTLSSNWFDAVYLSTDEILDASDKLLAEHKHIGDLPSGSLYEATIPVVIPNGVTGSYYLLAVADHKQTNYDININNNVVPYAITISAIPTPDLQIEELSIVDPCFSGQSFRIAYTVKNNGIGSIQAGVWNDKIYLSTEQTLNDKAELLKNTLKQNFNLASGESYKDTVSIAIPLSKTGNYVLFLHVDANDAIYEYNGEDNNVANTNILASLPLPGDLVPENIQSEKQIISGDYLHISWDITNKGDNPISSNALKDLVYLSSDTNFDISDKLIGQFTGNASIASYASVKREITSRISGVKEGEYYLLVKTDVTNSVNESDKSNNLGYGIYPVSIQLKELPINTQQDIILENDYSVERKIVSSDIVKETVLVQVLSADSLKGAVNNIYIANNDIADNINHAFSSAGQFSANPQVYIPSAQPQYYGISVDGQTPVGNQQDISIQANILPFEVRSISPNYGGNTGQVTVELLGAKFSPEMEVWLEKDSTFIDADTLIYDGFHKAFAVFDLKGKDIGQYSLSVFNFCEGETLLKDAFEIRGETTEGLSTNLILPSSSRPNRTISITLEYGNTGNTDILHPVVYVYSHAESPIGLTQAALNENRTMLPIALQVEGDPIGVLRPGSYGTVTFYAYTTGGLIFTIEKGN